MTMYILKCMHIKIIIEYERNAFVMRFPDLSGGGGGGGTDVGE